MKSSSKLPKCLDAAREVVLAYRQRFARNERKDSLFGPIDTEITTLENALGEAFLATGIRRKSVRPTTKQGGGK